MSNWSTNDYPPLVQQWQHDVSANQLHLEGVHLVTPSIGIPYLQREVGARAWGQGLTLSGMST